VRYDAAMAQDIYDSQIVRLSDLVVTDDIIRGKSFTNCLIVGPAVVAPMGHTSINNCVFIGTPDALYWDVSERGLVIGAIALEDCTFEDCRFERTGFAGTEELYIALGGARSFGERR
jgi:hypothetical protein